MHICICSTAGTDPTSFTGQTWLIPMWHIQTGVISYFIFELSSYWDWSDKSVPCSDLFESYLWFIFEVNTPQCFLMAPCRPVCSNKTSNYNYTLNKHSDACLVFYLHLRETALLLQLLSGFFRQSENSSEHLRQTISGIAGSSAVLVVVFLMKCVQPSSFDHEVGTWRRVIQLAFSVFLKSFCPTALAFT